MRWNSYTRLALGGLALPTLAILLDLLVFERQPNLWWLLSLLPALVLAGAICSQDRERQILEEKLWDMLQSSDTTEALKIEAELHALQNQINPHFLYNTLEIIRSRAMVQGNMDVARMVEALALQFRYCINHSGEMATVEQELDNIHNYLLIQRYRYGDRFSFREVLGEPAGELLQYALPIMTLQPLIENALVHGVCPKVEGGSIVLRISRSASRLHIQVEDNGVGIGEEDLLQIRRVLQGKQQAEKAGKGKGIKLGIALPNVNQRVKHYFGDAYGLDLTSLQGVGTTITLTIPLKEIER